MTGAKEKSGPQTDPMNEKVASNSKYTRQQVVEAMRVSGGIMSAAAKVLNCDRMTVARSCKDPIIAQAVREISETTIDMAEGKLLQAINNGNLTATIFYLKSRGKGRGWSERTEVTGPNGAPVAVQQNAPTIDWATLDLDLATKRKLRDAIRSGLEAQREAESKAEAEAKS